MPSSHLKPKFNEINATNNHILINCEMDNSVYIVDDFDKQGTSFNNDIKIANNLPLKDIIQTIDSNSNLPHLIQSDYDEITSPTTSTADRGIVNSMARRKKHRKKFMKLNHAASINKNKRRICDSNYLGRFKYQKHNAQFNTYNNLIYPKFTESNIFERFKFSQSRNIRKRIPISNDADNKMKFLQDNNINLGSLNVKIKPLTNNKKVISGSNNSIKTHLHSYNNNKLNFRRQIAAPSTCINLDISTIVLEDSDNDDDVQYIGCSTLHSVTSKNQKELRYIIIDGSNVAFTHGGQSKLFSCKGIELVVEYFLRRGHDRVVAIVPQARRRVSDKTTKDSHILERLAARGRVNFTPSRVIENKSISSYDDRYILKLASLEDGVIVSNDNFRDLYNQQADWNHIIQNRVLPYMFHGDVFMPPDDPLGRNGPSLEQFLRHLKPILLSSDKLKS